ncbi:hypothetical protein LZ32DRAFT_641213 [Colletotrichum eremochloae]|nr:hypothetical protein LZ32DRAFT_641213 [Colletotrichum eremochloae]
MLCKSWFGYVRTYKEVSMDMIMALSVQSLVNALGEQVTAGSCDLCRAKHCQDVHRIAIGMSEATISWTCSLKYSEEIFKSYGVHRALGHPCTEEANLATFENRPTEALASVPPSQQYHVPQISPSSPVSSEDFPMRVPKKKAGRQTKQLSAKLRMKIVLQEREAMFKELEAEHKRRVWELQAQANLDDAGISSALGEGDREEDANDEQIDFYLDDDSISVSERIRPLTYVSSQRSPNGSNPSTPQAPSPSSRRKLVALPAIPPVSPLHVTEFGFLAKPAEHFHRFSDRMDGQCDASSSDCSVKTAETTSKGELGRDILGPASRMSSGSALRKGPEIRAFAPPRPARAPVFCITHGVEKQNGCQRCEVGAFREIGLKPGEHMDFPEPEPEQL